MATIYSDKAMSGAGRAVHAGTNTVKATVTYGAPTTSGLQQYNSTTASVGDVLYFCKLPNQATVTSVVFYGTAGDMLKVGTDSSTARFYTSSSAITTLHVSTQVATAGATGIGYTFSASNDSTLNYEWITATTLVAAATNGSAVTCVVQYTVNA